MQVVHHVVDVERRRVAGGALRLAEEERLAAPLALGGLRRGRAGRARSSLGAGGKSSIIWNRSMCGRPCRGRVDDDPLLLGVDLVAVEVGGPLLELGEVLAASGCTASSRRSAGCSRRGCSACRAGTGAAAGRMSGVSWNWPVVWPLTWQSKQATPRLGCGDLAVVGGVELLLRHRRQQQAQAVELHRGEDVLEQLAEVVDRDDLRRARRRPARGGSAGRWPAGTRAGTPRAGRSPRRTAPAGGTSRSASAGRPCPPGVCLGCGSDG